MGPFCLVEDFNLSKLDPNTIWAVCSMELVPEILQRQLCEQICASIRVEKRFDGELMLETDLGFPMEIITPFIYQIHKRGFVYLTRVTH